MSRNEAIIVGRIDRRRERAEAKEDRAARRLALQSRANAVVSCEIGELPADDHADFAEALAASVRVQLIRLHGASCAVNILGREAGKAGEGLLLRKIAAADAERLFAKAANDGDAG